MKILIVLSMSLSMGIGFLAFGEESKHKHHEAHAGHMLEAYEKISHALFQDNLEVAKAEAAKMADHDEESLCAKHAEAIADAKSLEEAREHFTGLSQAAIELAAGHKKGHYTVMHCPMVKGGRGDWLQHDASEVHNPYFGSKMPHCGGPKKPKG